MKIIGCNNASGVGELGLKKNIDTILEKYPNLIIEKVIEPEFIPQHDKNNMNNLKEVVSFNQELANVCRLMMENGFRILNLIGDHSASIGTISASASQAKDLGVIWIDAHPDLNTDKTTPTQNIHGMSMAVLLNLFDSPLNNIVYSGPKIKPEHIVYIGLRSIDVGEQETLERLNIMHFKYEEVMKLGVYEVINQTLQHLKDCDKVHISIDVDCLDPKLAPGVSIPVEKGFDVDEVKDLLLNFMDSLPVIALDITEYNPEYDCQDMTITIVYELIESIGGFYETKS